MKRLAEFELVGEVRYCGLVGGVELVADKTTRRAFKPAQGVGPLTAKLLEENGLILRAMGDTIGLCPPMVISEGELNELFDRLEKALRQAEEHVTKEKLRAA